MSELSLLQQSIGCVFHDEALLRTALTHPSVNHELGNSAEHNQRLEYLGDAVLQLVLTEELFKRFPNADEGSLTKVRSRLVNRRYLAELGQRLDLGRHLVLGRGDEIQGGRERPSTLADAFEALLGAIFLDAGWLAAREFLLRLYRDRFDGLLSAPDSDNPKGELQELLQVGSAAPPTYQLKRTVGPDHDRLFECAVYHQGVELGRGRGKSKKDAETQAARTALAGLRARRQALDNGRADAEAPQ